MNQNVGLEDGQPGPSHGYANASRDDWMHDEDYASLHPGSETRRANGSYQVVGCERLLAQYVTEWVDGGDTVEEDSRAEEKAPRYSAPPM